MFIGKRIKELRLKKGMTQLELANLLFVTDRTVSKWEQEKGNPDYNSLIGLSTILGSSIDYLITGKEYVPSKDENTEKVVEYFENIIGERIDNEYSIRVISKYLQEYTADQVKDALDKSYNVYLKNKKLYNSLDIRDAIEKLGGILHNQSLSPLDGKISHLISYLSKNTTSPNANLKRRCASTIKRFLSLFSNDDEKKIIFVEQLYKISLDKRYSIHDLVSFLEREIEKQRLKNERQQRIRCGYIQLYSNTTIDINATIVSLNKAIRENDVGLYRKSFYILIQETYSFVIQNLDEEIEKDSIPQIINYVKDLETIFGRYISSYYRYVTEKLVSKYFDGNMEKISFDDLDCLDDLERYLFSKIDRNLKSGKNNFNRFYFNRQAS